MMGMACGGQWSRLGLQGYRMSPSETSGLCGALVLCLKKTRRCIAWNCCFFATLWFFHWEGEEGGLSTCIPTAATDCPVHPCTLGRSPCKGICSSMSFLVESHSPAVIFCMAGWNLLALFFYFKSKKQDLGFTVFLSKLDNQTVH